MSLFFVKMGCTAADYAAEELKDFLLKALVSLLMVVSRQTERNPTF